MEAIHITTDDLPALVAHYHGPLMGYAARRVGLDQAEDIVQEAWYRLARALGQGKAVEWEHVSGYLYQIVLRLILDRIRHEQPGICESLETAERLPTLPGPERVVEVRDLVRRGLALRSGAECYLLLLAQQGYRYQEIAERFHESEGCTKMRLLRLRRALAAWYARQEVA